jgi:hypothetical protein
MFDDPWTDRLAAARMYRAVCFVTWVTPTGREIQLAAIEIMPSREFVDSEGRVWRVWNTVPTERGLLAAGYSEGWLTFESPSELRRLTPIPPGWDEMPEGMLESLCRRAELATRRSDPSLFTERPRGPSAPPS